MKIAIDEEAWKAQPRVRTVVKADDFVPPAYLFTLIGRSEQIPAKIVDDGAKIEIFPERSASHKALQDALT